MKEPIFLSIIIPCYNEETNIEYTLNEILTYLSKKTFNYEIIIIDDGSTDNTADIADEKASNFENFSLITNGKNKGKGYSLRRGVLAAKGEFILFMDADNSTSIYEFDKFLPCLKQGYSVVIGSRRLRDSVVKVSQPVMRIILGQTYIFLSKFILNLTASDINCGFKTYKNAVAKKIFSLQKLDGWGFDAELLFLIKKYNLKMKEVSVCWVHKSTSKVRPLKDGINSFLDLIRVRARDLHGDYEE